MERMRADCAPQPWLARRRRAVRLVTQRVQGVVKLPGRPPMSGVEGLRIGVHPLHKVTTAMPQLATARQGFTLIELMVTVAITAILASVALPSYSAYIQRSRVPAALEGLSTFATRMEQRYQDVGHYANATVCAVAVPTVPNFTVSCAIGSGTTANQSFTATATGSGSMTGYTFTVDQAGVRRTTAHPKGLPATNCWSTRGGSCDG